ncbi:MAG: oligoribonuclease [bacterium]
MVEESELQVEFVCLDLETTGLDPEEEVILEVGITLCDNKLNKLATWESLVWPGEYDLDSLNDIVAKMHGENGLLDELAQSSASMKNPSRVAHDAVNWLESFGVKPNSLPMMGSSVHFDRAFLKKHMPELEAFFTYRNVDISSIKEFAKHLGLEVHSPKDSVAHRALADTGSTITEARFYYDTFFAG